MERKYTLLAAISPARENGIMPQEISTAAVSERKNTISASMALERFLWETILEMPSVLKRMNRIKSAAVRLISR